MPAPAASAAKWHTTLTTPKQKPTFSAPANFTPFFMPPPSWRRAAAADGFSSSSGLNMLTFGTPASLLAGLPPHALPRWFLPSRPSKVALHQEALADAQMLRAMGCPRHHLCPSSCPPGPPSWP
eukprot:1150815-Pelagomonas_calceolata.AAC.2